MPAAVESKIRVEGRSALLMLHEGSTIPQLGRVFSPGFPPCQRVPATMARRLGRSTQDAMGKPLGLLTPRCLPSSEASPPAERRQRPGPDFDLRMGAAAEAGFGSRLTPTVACGVLGAVTGSHTMLVGDPGVDPAAGTTEHQGLDQPSPAQRGSDPNGTVSLQAQVPEALIRSMRRFIDQHPSWDQYRLVQAALAGFLVQNGIENRDLTRCYLANLFPGQGGFEREKEPRNGMRGAA